MVEPWKIETANESSELRKRKHKNLVFSECGLFLDKEKCFIGTSPNHLMTCDCCEDAYIEIKSPLSVNCEKPN